MLIDLARIHVIAGKGGDGCVSFRREKYVPKGGPDGGDGGHGGSVTLVVDAHVRTLLDCREAPRYRADSGRPGSGNNRTGKDGEDVAIKIPPGTVVKDAESGTVLADLVEMGSTWVAASGGKGGRGNARFATPTHQAPRRADPGEPGEERWLELELKLIADVGLVGEPNAGKSTFLAAVTDARPRIADYPFTTLQPNLGVAKLGDFRTFVVADIPGIIEGAHEGKGLGLQFLRHVERTRTLALLVPMDSPDPQAEYDLLRRELASHSDALARIPHCLVLTKADLLGPDDAPPAVVAPDAWATFAVSAVARQGLTPLLEALWTRTREVIREESPEEEWWTP